MIRYVWTPTSAGRRRYESYFALGERDDDAELLYLPQLPLYECP